LTPTDVVRLAVCDLLAGGKWNVLPELDCNTASPYSCAVLPSSSGQGRTFRVLMIGADRDKAQFNLHAFASSGEPAWGAARKCFDMEARQIWSVEQEDAVVCQGVAHWLFVGRSNHFHVLSANAETGQLSLALLPISKTDGFGYRLATTADRARLSLGVYSGLQVVAWTQTQERDVNGCTSWLCTSVIKINHKLTELIQQLQQPWSIWSGERSGTLLITDYHGERKYIVHLDARTLKEVTNHFRHQAWSTIMPVEIDWQAFFMLRLGGLR
jgi:hypothetical protein